jgi:hypothetical protein
MTAERVIGNVGDLCRAFVDRYPAMVFDRGEGLPPRTRDHPYPRGYA